MGFWRGGLCGGVLEGWLVCLLFWRVAGVVDIADGVGIARGVSIAGGMDVVEMMT